MSVEPNPGHLGREPLAPASALDSAERSTSLPSCHCATPSGSVCSDCPNMNGTVTLWSGSLDDVGTTLINAGRELARAEDAIDDIDDVLRAEAELYAALADGLAARLRSLG